MHTLLVVIRQNFFLVLILSICQVLCFLEMSILPNLSEMMQKGNPDEVFGLLGFCCCLEGRRVVFLFVCFLVAFKEAR